MKIRNRHLVGAAGWVLTRSAIALVRSLRFQSRCVGPNVAPGQPDQPEGFIYAIWHDHLLLPTIKHGGPDFAVLISAHADGQLLGSLIRAMRMRMILGSSTRGGVEAVRQLIRPDVPWKNLAVTPDGPRGPRRIVQPGIVYVASRTGRRIVTISVGYDRPWQLRSWDRF